MSSMVISYPNYQPVPNTITFSECRGRGWFAIYPEEGDPYCLTDAKVKIPLIPIGGSRKAYNGDILVDRQLSNSNYQIYLNALNRYHG